MQLFKGKVAGDFCCPCADSFASFRLLINADSEICTAQFPIHFIDDAFTDYFPAGAIIKKKYLSSSSKDCKKKDVPSSYVNDVLQPVNRAASLSKEQ